MDLAGVKRKRKQTDRIVFEVDPKSRDGIQLAVNCWSDDAVAKSPVRRWSRSLQAAGSEGTKQKKGETWRGILMTTGL